MCPISPHNLFIHCKGDLFWVKGREHQKCVLISPEGLAELLRLLNWLFYIQIQNSRVGEN